MNKPMKVYAASPLNHYLATVPTKADIVALMNERQAANLFNGKDITFEQIHEREKKPLSNSQHINRLAERYLWLRREYFPILSEPTWIDILSELNGRSQLSIQELREGIELILPRPSENDLETENGYTCTDNTSTDELSALTQAQLLVVMEMVEWYWGRKKDDKYLSMTLAQELSIYSGIYEGFCLSDTEYSLCEHWTIAKAASSHHANSDPSIEAVYLVHHKAGVKAQCYQKKDSEKLSVYIEQFPAEASTYERERLGKELYQFIEASI
ncbi:hypothetical protein LRP52_35990 [Photobacterium sp. ZSDE20]|uniref:Uncharacterized protein n=1 Tax=Photobacterium pectinilyticum TaxID=2906793 RepID=A0ABT1N8X3_9GAMM|nr:hypothetical protein [Photobacterium sp. ZSDE20]MCQ1060131.1 hypothetical protein [Photobacterium sp. ZSDE20]MDD1827587.1 hypothetical protein [Photobacterium sp. ZSDE20]